MQLCNEYTFTAGPNRLLYTTDVCVCVCAVKISFSYTRKMLPNETEVAGPYKQQKTLETYRRCGQITVNDLGSNSGAQNTNTNLSH